MKHDAESRQQHRSHDRRESAQSISEAARPLSTLLTAQPSSGQFFHQQFATATLVYAVLDPLVAICALGACIYAFGEPFTGSYLILALIVFALTYPAKSPQGTGFRQLVSNVLLNWLVVISLLLFIGWATRTIEFLNPRVLVAWGVATPLLLLGANLLLPRMLAAQGVQRSAVIAGEGELGRTLAKRIRAAPHCGIRFVGYFDDRGLERAPGLSPHENLGVLSDLADYVKQHRIDLIYITLPLGSQPRIVEAARALQDTTASIFFVPDVFGIGLIQGALQTRWAACRWSPSARPRSTASTALVKRTSDVSSPPSILLLISPRACWPSRSASS